MKTIIEHINNITGGFADEARKCDRDNVFPVNNFQVIKDNDLLGLIIPKQFGGQGVDFANYQQCVSAIAKHCASTASAFNMHNIILGALADIPYQTLDQKQAKLIMPFVERIFNEVIQNKKVFASATSEPGIGARYSKTKTSYEKVEGGYLINGEKFFVTMANYADYYSIIANKKTLDDQPASTHHLSFFLVPSKQPGITIIEDWDTLGMRATQSHRLIFNNAFVPNENIFFGVTGFALAKIIRTPHWVIGGYMGIYLGIMEAAYDFTLNYIKSRTNYDNKTGLGFETIIQIRLAEMYALYQQSLNAINTASHLILNGSATDEAHRALYLAKYTVGEAVMELTSKAIKTCGASMIHKKFDLERFFRDSRCGALMPATSDVCQLYIGRSLLDLPIEPLW